LPVAVAMTGSLGRRRSPEGRPSPTIQRCAALVLAAGSSQRFGGRPKQFEDLGGVTVLQRAVHAFTGADGIDEVWVVASEEQLERTRDLLADEGIAGVVAGGLTRADSTLLGLGALTPDVSHVIVHDAARPLVPRQVVDRCVKALADSDVVATVVEPADSVVILDGDEVVAMPDRNRVRLYQTPQAFRRSVLADAWERLAESEPGSASPTDDVTAVLRVFPDEPVAWVDGDRRSAKITLPEDLDALRALL
jgi:2-C-methyl-D-erythritol 4-phosphate cytidylyltransferase